MSRKEGILSALFSARATPPAAVASGPVHDLAPDVAPQAMPTNPPRGQPVCIMTARCDSCATRNARFCWHFSLDGLREVLAWMRVVVSACRRALQMLYATWAPA